MTKEPKWAMSLDIFRKAGFPQLDDALRRAGIEYFLAGYNPKEQTYDDIPYDVDECVILYGPIRFVRQKNKGFVPGAFGFKKETDVSFYMSQLSSKLFFNSDAIFLPFGLIEERKDLIQDMFGDEIFIRPDSGFKSFTGLSLKTNSIQDELGSLRQTNNPFSNELCVVAKSKPILGEYRFVICEGEVVTGSQYRWDGKMDIRIDVHHECWEFAEKVAKANWQLDTCYVVDIFLGEDGPRIGEFNSFSSSGLYNCDMDRIVEAVTKAAVKEWE